MHIKHFRFVIQYTKQKCYEKFHQFDKDDKMHFITPKPVGKRQFRLEIQKLNY